MALSITETFEKVDIFFAVNKNEGKTLKLNLQVEET